MELKFDKHKKDAVNKELPLNKIKVGQSCVVVDIRGLSATKRRLIDMGVTPTVHITVKKTAPFGDPMQIHLRGYDLTLRKNEAMLIKVRRVV